MQAAARLYLAQHGGQLGGRPAELIIRDDGNNPARAKAHAQELLQSGVIALGGFGLTPLILAAAPFATVAQVPAIVMGASTSSIPSASPYILRTSFAAPQTTAVFGDWAGRTGSKRVVTIVSDYEPGIDTETWFKRSFETVGGQTVGSVRVPLSTTQFSPFLQQAALTPADALFIFVPSGLGAPLLRELTGMGLDRLGRKLLVAGAVLDEQQIDTIGDSALNLVSAFHYSDAHDSDLRRQFTSAFESATGMRTNLMAVGAYDGLALLDRALTQTGGKTDGPTLLAAMSNQAWESPRGPVAIDPATRDIVQDVYLRRVRKIGGRLRNVEFSKVPHVKDPGKLPAYRPEEIRAPLR
jgi:branched-chain amino acid transport system substrate-binding protein